MKAERRHELQANELAKQLETLPEKLKRHATSILLFITAVVVVIYVVRYRSQQQQLRRLELANSTAQALTGPQQLRMIDAQRLPPAEVARMRQQVVGETNTAIETILREAEGDHAAALRAEALVARGDLNWALANLHPLPEAATQPALKLPRTPDDYLRSAADSYESVVANYTNQLNAWVAAQFGLGAIAENRHDWERARAAYGAILANNDTPDIYRTQATLRLNAVLPLLQEAVLVGNFGTPIPTTTAPTTAPGSASTEDAFSITPKAPAASQPK